MKTYGIRISDGKENVLCPNLHDILEEIDEIRPFYWSILFLDGTPNPDKSGFLAEYEKKINNSENGVLVSRGELENLSSKFFQMFEITVLGSKDVNLLRRYENEKDMYRTCDIAIELIDCVFWEVYVKDYRIIERLESKFKEIEFLKPNFEK